MKPVVLLLQVILMPNLAFSLQCFHHFCSDPSIDGQSPSKFPCNESSICNSGDFCLIWTVEEIRQMFDESGKKDGNPANSREEFATCTKIPLITDLPLGCHRLDFDSIAQFDDTDHSTANSNLKPRDASWRRGNRRNITFCQCNTELCNSYQTTKSKQVQELRMGGNPVRCVNDWNGEDRESIVKFPYCHFEEVPETGWFLRSGGWEIAPWTRTHGAAMISLWDLNMQGKIWQIDRWGAKDSFCYKWNATEDRNLAGKYQGVVEQCVCRTDECNKKQMANYDSDPPLKFVKCHHTSKTPLEPTNSSSEICLGNYCVFRREFTIFKSNLPIEEFRSCLNSTEVLPVENFRTDDGQFVWVFCNDANFCNDQDATQNYRRIDEILNEFH